MPRVISSAQTFLTKFILPFVVAAVMTFGLVLGGRTIWPFFLRLEVVVVVSFYWDYARLKKVTVDAEGLLISNYFREIEVPWRHIVQVSGSRWVSIRQVTVTFDRHLGCGASVMFMPKVRMLWPGQERPVAQELRDMVRANHAR